MTQKMSEKMKMPKSMIELRKMLDLTGIKWEDDSINSDTIFTIWRTKINTGEFKEISVINGFGTYGGYSLDSASNLGLLEWWNGVGDPTGYLTAEEAFMMTMQELKKSKE